MHKVNDAEDPVQAPNDFGEVKGFEFNEKTIRQAFVRKVYLILMAQLLATFGLVAFFTFHEGAGKFARQNREIAFICMIFILVLVVSMACCEGVRRKAPMNFIFLFLFTAAEGILLGFCTSYMKDKNMVLLAVGITAVICFSLTLFAFQTKYDFTGCGTYLFIFLICITIFGFVLMFFHNTVPIAQQIYSALGALLFSFYLVYDTQLMLGGNHKYALSPEEYIFAALNLYLDIINLFIYILRLLR